MGTQNVPIYYLSASIAIVGTVGYHHLVKKIPATVDPIVSIIGIYLGVLMLGVVLMPLVYSGGRIAESVRQLGWVQVGIAVCIFVMELGFILMYRSGWNLSVGNVVTGVAINLALMIIGVVILHEKLSLTNMLGVLLCIVGVAMIGFRGTSEDDAVVTQTNLQAPVAPADHQARDGGDGMPSGAPLADRLTGGTGRDHRNALSASALRPIK